MDDYEDYDDDYDVDFDEDYSGGDIVVCKQGNESKKMMTQSEKKKQRKKLEIEREEKRKLELEQLKQKKRDRDINKKTTNSGIKAKSRSEQEKMSKESDFHATQDLFDGLSITEQDPPSLNQKEDDPELFGPPVHSTPDDDFDFM